MLNSIKAWFKYSWSIFLARLETFLGLGMASVSLIDWSPIIGGVQTGLTWAQGVTIGSILFIKGLVSELGRRQGSVELSDGQLIPAVVSEKAEAVKVIKAN